MKPKTNAESRRTARRLRIDPHGLPRVIAVWKVQPHEHDRGERDRRVRQEDRASS
jgi:hypothetical protein